MNKKEVIKETAKYVKNKLDGESSGHDWWHTYRVWKNAVKIAKKEKADLFIVELAAILHDVADYKLNNGDETLVPKLVGGWLSKLRIKENIIIQVCKIIETMSFKGGKKKSIMKTKEGMIVQDADRLDAIGAVGIARVFAYGGAKKEKYIILKLSRKSTKILNIIKIAKILR